MRAEGGLLRQVQTAATHVLIAYLITFAVGSAFHGAERLRLIQPVVEYIGAGLAAGWGYGFYVGREAAEPDPFTNRGSVLDMLGGLVGALGALGTLNALGWIIF